MPLFHYPYFHLLPRSHFSRVKATITLVFNSLHCYESLFNLIEIWILAHYLDLDFEV